MDKKLFTDIDFHLLNDENPSEFIEYLYSQSLLNQSPLTMLSNLKNTPQSPKYHPEGDVWNHTMLVIDEAAKVKDKSSNEKVFMWAALLHDIGKPSTTKNRSGKITSYDHEKVGSKMAVEFFNHFNVNDDFINKVSALIRWHMQILHVVKNLPFADMKNMTKQSDFNDVALLGLCDRLGRLGANKKEEEENIKVFLKKCNTFTHSYS